MKTELFDKVWQKKAIEALQESIAHWERLRDEPQKCRDRRETPRGDSCPCCKTFYINILTASYQDCPIAFFGHPHCGGTPWKTAHELWEATPWGDWPGGDEQTWKSIAQKEIVFLRKILRKVRARKG